MCAPHRKPLIRSRIRRQNQDELRVRFNRNFRVQNYLVRLLANPIARNIPLRELIFNQADEIDAPIHREIDAAVQFRQRLEQHVNAALQNAIERNAVAGVATGNNVELNSVAAVQAGNNFEQNAAAELQPNNVEQNAAAPQAENNFRNNISAAALINDNVERFMQIYRQIAMADVLNVEQNDVATGHNVVANNVELNSGAAVQNNNNGPNAIPPPLAESNFGNVRYNYWENVVASLGTHNVETARQNANNLNQSELAALYNLGYNLGAAVQASNNLQNTAAPMQAANNMEHNAVASLQIDNNVERNAVFSLQNDNNVEQIALSSLQIDNNVEQNAVATLPAGNNFDAKNDEENIVQQNATECTIQMENMELGNMEENNMELDAMKPDN